MDYLLELILLAGGILGYFQLRQKNNATIRTLQAEEEAKRKALEAKAQADRSEQHNATQEFIRAKLDEERHERQRLDKTIDALAQANSRHAELRAAAETQAEERKATINMQERVIGETVDKALKKTEEAAIEKTKREMLERENTELRNRLKALEIEVKRIPNLENEINLLRGKIELMEKDHAQEEREMQKEVDRLSNALVAQGER